MSDTTNMTDFLAPDASHEDITKAVIADDDISAATENITVAEEHPTEAAAKNRQVGKTLGVPGSIVGQMPDEFHADAKAVDIRKILLDNPGLRKHTATTPSFAEVGHDDMPHLAAVETGLGAVTDAFAKADVADSRDMMVAYDKAQNAAAAQRYRTKFALDRGDQYAAPKLGEYADSRFGLSGATAAGSWLIETGAQIMNSPYLIAGAIGQGLGMKGAADLEAGALNAAQESEIRAMQLTPDVGGGAAQKGLGYARTAVENLPLILTGGGAKVAGWGGKAAAAIGAGAGSYVSGVKEYADLRQSGVGVGKASLGGVLNAGLEFMGEYLPLKTATRLMGKSGVGKFMWEVGGQDIVGEEFSGISELFVSNAIKGISVGDTMAQLPQTMIDSALGSLATTGMMTGIHATAKVFHTAEAEQDINKQLQAAFSTVNAAKMMQHDPAELGKYVDALSQSGLTHVFVDAASLVDAVKDPNTLPPELRKAIEDSYELKGDVAVPVGVFATQILPSAPNLAQEIRLSQGGMTVTESEAFVKNAEEHFKAQTAETMKQYEAQAPMREEARTLHADIMKQLKKASPQFGEDAHRAYASMFTNMMVTLAHRSGKSINEVMGRGLALTGTEISNQQVGYAQAQQAVEQTLQQRKDATKAMLIEQQAAGKVAPDAAFRGASIGELRSIAQGGQLVIGKDAEGHAGISAAPINKEGFPVYGEGVGYIVPKQHQSDSGRMAEVMVDPKAHPEDMQYVVNGQIVNYAQLKELLGKPTEAQQKAKDELTKLLESLTAGEDVSLDFTQAQGLEDIAAKLAEEKAKAAAKPSRRGYHLGANMRADNGPSIIGILETADLSTFIHETGHFAAEAMASLANLPDVPAEFKANFDQLLDWAGAKGKTPEERLAWFTNTGTTGEEKSAHLRKVTEAHENIARGLEKYFGEGKAPTVELKSIFATMRDFIKRAYTTLSLLNVKLTPEVRSVFDRMIATDEQIQNSEDLLNLEALFKSAKEAGMTPEEWTDYVQETKNATDDAKRILDKSTMRDMAWTRNALSRALRSIHKDVEAKRKEEVANATEGLMKDPVYKVRDFLQTGRIEAPADATQDQRRAIVAMGQLKHKLSLPALKAMYGDGPAAPWRYLTTGKNAHVAGEDGVHPDLVAAVFGFQSGDAMVKSLLETPSLKEAAEELADASLIQKYGDIRNPSEMARAAELAVMNDARTRLAATQLRALTRSTGSVAMINKAAKRVAENIINSRSIRNILPGQFEAMVAKSGRAAMTALKEGKIQDAAQHERNRLLAMHATKMAVKAKEQIARDIKMMRDAVKSKTIPADYSAQIEALLERFNLHDTNAAQQARNESLLQWVEKQRAMGIEPNLPEDLLNEANRLPYQDMKFSDFHDLANSVRTIKKLGELKTRLLNAKDKREFAAIVAETVKDIKDNATGNVAERMAGEHGFRAKMGKLFRGFTAEHRKFSSIMRQMDQFKEGGPMWERFVRPMNEAADNETSMLAEYTKKLADVLKPAFEHGMTKKVHVAEVNRTFTYEQLLGIASNMGNTANRERVLSGEKWTPEQLKAVLSHLTKEDFAMIQKTWDLLSEFKPKIAEKQQRLTGVESEWVQPEPFVTPHGDVLPGGYMPIKYDPNRSERAREDTDAMVERQMNQGLYTRATTQRGHEEARAEHGGRPLRYDFTHVVTSHVNQVIHDLAWHEHLIDANRLLGNEGVTNAIRDHYGPETVRELKRTLRDIAVGNLAAQEGWDQVFNHMKTGTTIAGLGWNLSTSMMQFLGATQSVERIGAVPFFRGLGKFVGSPSRMQKQADEVYEKSKFMHDRSLTQNRALNELSGKVTGETESAVRSTFFWTIHQMQKMVDLPTWQGQYDAMLAEGHDEKTAIALADQAVRDSQGSGLISDRAGIERGSAGRQLFTAFYSFFNSTYNLAAESANRNKGQGVVGVMKMLSSYMLLFAMPATMASILKIAMQGLGKDDDPEKLAKRLLKDNLSYLLGTMVGVRELAAAFAGPGSYSGPAGTRFISEAVKLMGQVGQGQMDRALFKAAINSAGILFHLPTVQVERTLEGIVAIAEGKKVSPLAPVAGIPPGMKL